MRSFTVAIINGNYIFQLQSSHHQAVYIRSKQRNYIPVVYTLLQIISGQDLGLKGTYDSHTQNIIYNINGTV
jgi:hypothetical protein